MPSGSLRRGGPRPPLPSVEERLLRPGVPAQRALRLEAAVSDRAEDRPGRVKLVEGRRLEPGAEAGPDLGLSGLEDVGRRQAIGQGTSCPAVPVKAEPGRGKQPVGYPDRILKEEAARLRFPAREQARKKAPRIFGHVFRLSLLSAVFKAGGQGVAGGGKEGVLAVQGEHAAPGYSL